MLERRSLKYVRQWFSMDGRDGQSYLGGFISLPTSPTLALFNSDTSPYDQGSVCVCVCVCVCTHTRMCAHVNLSSTVLIFFSRITNYVCGPKWKAASFLLD